MAQVIRNDQSSRYEARDGDDVQGFADYRVSGDVVTMIHTEVDDRFQGQGVAGRLVRHALDDIRDRGLRVRPVCEYVAGYLNKHPEYADIVAPNGSSRRH